MTSATGVDNPQRNQAGFTLIELLTVITILVVLMGLAVVALGKARTSAQVNATQSLIDRLATFNVSYKAKMGMFPADGYEERVATATEETPLFSGSALGYILSNEVTVEQKLAGGRTRMVVIDAIGEFQQGELARSEDDPEVVEILDAFSEPIHYDRLQGEDSYSPQDVGEDCHANWDEEIPHHPDPRESDAVKEPGAQNTNEFDLWSHGPHGHTEEELPSEAIANFSVGSGGEE